MSLLKTIDLAKFFHNVRFLNGSHYRIKSGKVSFSIPANMQYRFSK